MRPVYLTFPVAGIQVLDGKYFCNESTCRVDLSLLGAKSTGNFKCEVSGDAPHFKLAAKEDNMTVAGEAEAQTVNHLTHLWLICLSFVASTQPCRKVTPS